MAGSTHYSAPVYFGDRLIGVIDKIADQGRLRFTYEHSWRDTPGIWPLSLSLPMSQAVHTDARREINRPIEHFLWGLLPDNNDTIAQWAGHFGVGRLDPLAILCEIGADCPGAISFIEPVGRGSEEPVDTEAIARELRRLQESLPSRLAGDHGQFSLAGAQAKTALRKTTHGWAIPRGGLPSTHILKPAMTGLADQAVNEHFCLELARQMGLPAAQSEVVEFDGLPVLVIKRFDRYGGGRLHQEDFCQALGVHPRNKYQADGGPGLSDMMQLLDSHSGDPMDDQQRLYRAVLFNLMIAGTDAHSKNFALIYPPTAGQPRLAPLYDLNSMFPYAAQRRDMRSSLRIAGCYKLYDIQRRHLIRRITGARLGEQRMAAQLDMMLGKLPRAAATLANEMADRGNRSDIPATIAQGITHACARWRST
jgi:HipA N-terminal domain